MFESPGNFWVYQKIRGSTFCHLFFVQSSAGIQSFWACFHEKEELLRVKCLRWVALLDSERCEQARSPSAEKVKHYEACLCSHGCLVCWEVCAPIHLAFSAASFSSTEAPGSICPSPSHLPQSPGWGILSIQQSQSNKACVCIVCLPSIKGIQHSHLPQYSLCFPVSHQLVITSTHHITVYCIGMGRQW